MLIDHIRFNRIIFRHQVFTKDYTAKAVDDCSKYLDDHIHSNSPVVYLIAPNHIKTVIAFLAIVKTGRTCLLVDPGVGSLEYEEMLEDSTPSAIITIDPGPIEFDFDKEVAVTDYHMDPALVSQLDDVCLLLYTAAEDGFAKAAMLTHENLLSNAIAINKENRADENGVSCGILPFHHLFGFQNGVISPLIAGGSFLICDISDMQKISLIIDDILQHKISFIYSVPLIYYLLSKSLHISEIGRQTYSMISGGYKLPAALRARFEKLNIPIYEGYGLTEASPVCTWQRKMQNFHRDSVGMPIVNYQIRIIDESGNEVPRGAKGEICVFGDNVFKGYFRHSEATQKVLFNGWLHTGDYGKIDDPGNLFFLGLKKRMFNVAGKKVYPDELQRLMMRNKNVEQVELWTEYHAMMGDRVNARIKLKNVINGAEKDFYRWCTRAINRNKLPHIFLYS